MENQTTVLAPMLYLKNLAAAIGFYKNAFDAVEQWHISNPDGSIHVAEITIGAAVLRMHEETGKDNHLSPETAGGTTVVMGLLVPDPDAVAAKAAAAGATIVSPVKDYEYGYRQGTIKDPFGHHWQIERTPAEPPLGAQ
ncbi:MAG TPA: VOC family protein [Chitinophaga sp.]|uniref:VOC family protein n=1 Tax=Chitinophaga sp. TaxID=1869181 RepID=UPI002DBFBFCC|nr:VOC family protein [Chitinophaga sp.]HEU4551296.1 VOC family protein [Chitinophaga sp.]